MSSNINCDFCGENIEFIYKPVNTKRGARVYICPNCSLVQTIYGVVDYDRAISISCDADWGNVRYGKKMRLEDNVNFISRHIQLDEIEKVLDIGANRGDFIRYINKNFPHISAVAIEPDSRVIDYYDLPVEIINDRIECVNVRDEFDLVYCSHTLEHVSSVSLALGKIFNLLSDDGFLFLEVPNLEGIATIFDNVEEFFIDKHSFHFTPLVLEKFIISKGFKVVDRNISDYNISILSQKSHRVEPFMMPSEAYDLVKNIILTYKDTLSRNREILRKFVDVKLSTFFERQTVGFWGAGRIFDAFRKYGGLRDEWVHVLVDKNLSSIVEEVNGLPLYEPEYLKVYEPQVIFVMSREGSKAIEKQACEMGFGKIVTFSEIFQQAYLHFVGVPA